MTANAAEVFNSYRPLLFSIAYEMLGSAADAEDVLQDSYLRWADVDRSTISNERSYLAQIVTRQSLNQLRTAQRRRETYVGPWLPEPIGTQADASADTILAESLSFAMLMMLESLSPAERAVFVLREVFDFPHAEIAQMLGKTDIAVRQVARRAKERVREGRKRFDVDKKDAELLLGEFLESVSSGDLDKLLSLLAEDVVAYGDGGGVAKAALRPVRGADRVARYLVGGARKGAAGFTYEFTQCNAMPAALVRNGDQVVAVMIAEIVDRKVSAVYFSANPAKLGFAVEPQQLSRN